MLSLDTPIISTFNFSKSLNKQLKSLASFVHPGVLSFG
ncbi:uncharacterized protein METZ01_LOCUS73346 [marine metagenome]|uniref:Uncharacterized protein n=1 Tax=marine metagenome TaxID=408172 RepID=A0A381TWV4_9ZZZZ